jgi:hypothetical protein
MPSRKIKNKILKRLNSFVDSQYSTPLILAEVLKIEINSCLVVCDNLIEEQYVNLVRDSTDKFEKRIRISPKGRVFINEGGYKSNLLESLKKNWISITAIVLSMASFATSLYSNYDQNKKWAETNLANIVLDDVKMQYFTTMTREQFDTTNFGYDPNYTATDKTYQLLNRIVGCIGTTRDAINTKHMCFTLTELAKELKERGYDSGYLVHRFFTAGFLFKNIGLTGAKDGYFKVEAKTIGGDWFTINNNPPTTKVAPNQKVSIISPMIIPLSMGLIDSLYFRIEIEYNDINQKRHFDTIPTVWASRTNMFYNINHDSLSVNSD